MTLRATRTFAILEVPDDFYELVRKRLVEAGYDHALVNENDAECLDMHGIALRRQKN